MMKRLLPALALVLAACTPPVGAGPAPSTSPSAAPTLAPAAGAVKLTVDGQSTPIAQTIVFNAQNETRSYAIGDLAGVAGTWFMNIAYTKTASGVTGFVQLSRRDVGMGDTQVYPYSLANGTDIPATAKGTFTEAGGKLDVKLTGTLKPMVGDGVESTFDLQATGLAL